MATLKDTPVYAATTSTDYANLSQPQLQQQIAYLESLKPTPGSPAQARIGEELSMAKLALQSTPVIVNNNPTGGGGGNPSGYGGGAGTAPGQVGGGGATGSMPGGATGFSGGFTQADIDKAFAAGQADATKVAKDNAYAVKQKAADKLVATFKANGIDDPAFADFISGQIQNDVSMEDTLINIYNQPAYKLRFPGMESLRAKNRTISEAEYIKLENTYAETLRFFDLPAGFMDDRKTFGKLIGNEVSAKELQDRAQVAQDIAKTTNPEIRNALKDFYNVGEGAVTAYFLDADKALPILQKQAKSAQIAGIGKQLGFNTFGAIEAADAASKSVYGNLGEADLTKAFGQAAYLRDTQSRLAYLEQTSYSDREALQATIESDQQAMLASQKRAQREVARFSGGSGLSSASLRQSSGI
jgi:hypothetical protein